MFGGSGGEIYTVFDEESESEVENLEILHPESAIRESHQKIENPYFPLFFLFLFFFGRNQVLALIFCADFGFAVKICGFRRPGTKIQKIDLEILTPNPPNAPH